MDLDHRAACDDGETQQVVPSPNHLAQVREAMFPACVFALLLGIVLPVTDSPQAMHAARLASRSAAARTESKAPTKHPSIVIPGKPRPHEEWYKGCPPWGLHSPDPLQDMLRNRIDTPSHVQDFSYRKFAALPWPRDVTLKHIPMAQWSRKDRSTIYRYLGEGVRLQGYLTAVIVGPREYANCNGKAGYDWHLRLGNSPHTDTGDTVITEATPRVRAREHGFSLKTMIQLRRRHARVRVTGWLFLDSGHAHQIEKKRVTLWEVHPVTRVDVWQTETKGGGKSHKGHWDKVAG